MLNASFSGSTGAATASGSITQLAQGAINSTNLLIGLNTSTVGPKTGAVTLGLQSDGTGTSNLGTLGLPSQTVNVSGTVFRLAEANSIAPVNFGNVLAGSTQTRTLTVSNVAARTASPKRSMPHSEPWAGRIRGASRPRARSFSWRRARRTIPA